MLTFVLLGLAGVVPLTLVLRRNAREQRAMNEAYDLWRETGEALPDWDSHYAWSEPLPVDEPAWTQPLRMSGERRARSTPPPPRLRPELAPPSAGSQASRWTEASALRTGDHADGRS